ncbi:hypothetical protein Tco_0567911 [Tanacetum coccineum]
MHEDGAQLLSAPYLPEIQRHRMDISIEMIGNSIDKILMLAVVDNILAGQPHLDCGNVPRVNVRCGSIVRNPKQLNLLQWAHFRHIHFGFMADHEAAVDTVNGTNMRQQLTAETIAQMKVVADMHYRKAQTPKHSDNSR